MAARIAECSTVVAIDVHDDRLTLAREIGATHVINSLTEDAAARQPIQANRLLIETMPEACRVCRLRSAWSSPATA